MLSRRRPYKSGVARIFQREGVGHKAMDFWQKLPFVFSSIAYLEPKYK